MIDRKTGEIVIIYNDEKTGHMNAEVYKFHDKSMRVATHFSAMSVHKAYIDRLDDPTPFDKLEVDKAIAFYKDFLRKKELANDEKSY